MHAALAPGGRLATVTTAHVRGGTVEFFAQAQECYLRWDPATDPDELLRSPAECRRPPTRSTPIRGSPRPSAGVTSATSPTPPTTTWPCCGPTPGHRALSPERRDGLLSCLRALIEGQYGGMITKTYLHELRVARAYHR